MRLAGPRGLVGVSLGGYSVLPSSLIGIPSHALSRASKRRRPPGRIPRSVLQRATGVFLPKTPFFRLLPQTLGPVSAAWTRAPTNASLAKSGRTTKDSQHSMRELVSLLNYLARYQEYLARTSDDVRKIQSSPRKSQNSRSKNRSQSH
jgi:hypothetical protein